MAKRKALSRTLAGMGVGITRASDLFLRQHLLDRSQDRYDQRARASQEAMLDRQGQMADRTQMFKVLEEVMKGGDPQAASEMLSLLTGTEIPAASMPRPGPRRRMESALGDSIAKATSPEMVPGDEEIVSHAKREGLALPEFASEGMAATSYAGEPDPYEHAGGIAREFGQRATRRRERLENKPTEKLEIEQPDGSKRVEFHTPYGGPIQVAPDAQQQGVISGTRKAAELGTAGPAMARQAGAEAGATAQARQDVEMSNAAIAKRVMEQGMTTGARTVAEINAKHANMQKVIDFEAGKAMAMLPIAANEVEFKQWGEQIAKAKEAASSAVPIISELEAAWVLAQPELEVALKRMPDLAVQLSQDYVPSALLTENVKRYSDLLESARPRLARIMGNVGNFTEGEQARAGYIAPGFLDAANGGSVANEKFARMTKLFMAAPSIAKRQRPGSPPITGAEIDQFLKNWEPAQEGDVNLPSQQPFDILITPNGITKPGGR